MFRQGGSAGSAYVARNCRMIWYVLIVIEHTKALAQIFSKLRNKVEEYMEFRDLRKQYQVLEKQMNSAMIQAVSDGHYIICLLYTSL